MAIQNEKNYQTHFSHNQTILHESKANQLLSTDRVNKSKKATQTQILGISQVKNQKQNLIQSKGMKHQHTLNGLNKDGSVNYII